MVGEIMKGPVTAVLDGHGQVRVQARLERVQLTTYLDPEGL
jgi:hypothetical protein